jgi:hypothetical protein
VAEGISINGTNLYTLMHSIKATRGLVGAPPVRGGDYETPRRGGALSGARWDGPRVVNISGLLLGNSTTALIPSDARGRYLDKARDLSALVRNRGRDFTIRREIPEQGGGTVIYEATGRYLAGLDSIEQVAAHAGRVSFDLLLLDPTWRLGPSLSYEASFSVTGTSSHTIAGDVETRKIVLTFSGATGQRLTNNTTGEWVQIVGHASNNTVVDVEDFTAVRSSVSVAGEVTHNGSFVDWLTLVPGSNSLTLTGGGSVTVEYFGAYL